MGRWCSTRGVQIQWSGGFTPRGAAGPARNDFRIPGDRLLEGGAEDDEADTFAFFHYAVAGLRVRF